MDVAWAGISTLLRLRLRLSRTTKKWLVNALLNTQSTDANC